MISSTHTFRYQGVYYIAFTLLDDPKTVLMRRELSGMLDARCESGDYLFETVSLYFVNERYGGMTLQEFVNKVIDI